MLDYSGTSTSVSDLSNCAADIVFFTFRSTITASDVDHRFPSTTLLLDFSLRLPKIVAFTATAPVINLPASILTPLGELKPVSFPSPASRP